VRPYMAFEGVDGAGKTVLARIVSEALRERFPELEVLQVREPGGTSVGEKVRKILLHWTGKVCNLAEVLLFATCRAQLWEEVISPALQRGAVVISDRSAYSSLAYQGEARGVGAAEVWTVNNIALQGNWPDLVFFLDVDPEVGFGREDEHDRISSEGLALQERVREGYLKSWRADPERIVRIDASKSLKEVFDEVMEIIFERFGWHNDPS